MKAVALLISMMLAAVAAQADDKHGGVEMAVGKYHVELVTQDRTLDVYVRDQSDKPIDPKTVKASANVLSGADKAAVPLAAKGPEALTGQVPFNLAPKARVVVTFSVSGAKSEQVRFSLGQKQDHKGHKH